MQAATAAGLRVPERGSQTSAPDTPLGEELSTNGMAALRPGEPEQAGVRTPQEPQRRVCRRVDQDIWLKWPNRFPFSVWRRESRGASSEIAGRAAHGGF